MTVNQETAINLDPAAAQLTPGAEPVAHYLASLGHCAH
jgi:hypothetical protein